VPSAVYGRAYGFERGMDNLGAIIGPLLAIALVAVFSTRTAILLSIIPGLLAVLAIIYAIRHTDRPKQHERQPIRIRIRPVMKGQLGRLLGAISIFEVGNIAATLLILRATDLLEPGRSLDDATQLAIGLYVLYNIAATLTSIPAGRMADLSTPGRVLSLGVAAFAIAYIGFAFVGASIPLLAVFFIAAGVGIGAVETAEHSAVATMAPGGLRGSSFGALAAIQSFGNLIASSVVGVIYVVASPTAAFLFPAVMMLGALIIMSRVSGSQI
jgi:MFS family permease